MLTTQVTMSVVVTGNVLGTTANPLQTSPVNAKTTNVGTSSDTGAGLVNEIVMAAAGTQTVTIAASGTLAVNLLTGQTNPLGENVVFARVKKVIIEHSSASLSSGVTVFGSGTNQFQGPLSAAATITLPASGGFAFWLPTATAWVVDGTHKTVQVVNNDAVNAATLSIEYFDGAKT